MNFLEKDPRLVNAVNSNGRFTLEMAAQTGQIELVKLLLENGAYINKRRGSSTSLHMAALYSGKTEIIGDLFNTDYVDSNKELEYYLFFSDKGKDRFSFQMYISFHNPDGTFIEPIFLGDKIHQGKRNTQSIISFDSKYLFFTRYFSIYWIDAKIIEELKPEDLNY